MWLRHTLGLAWFWPWQDTPPMNERVPTDDMRFSVLRMTADSSTF
jgi:hypothetical protein